MPLISALWNAVAAWLDRAAAAMPEPCEAASEDHGRSIRDATREQFGTAHWSCHSHF